VLEIVEKKVGLDHPFHHPLAGLIETLVEVDGSYDSFEGIAKDLTHLQTAVELVEVADLLKSHLDSYLIELVAVDHLASHLGEKAFFFVGIFFEQEIGDDGAEDGVAEILQAFVVLVRPVLYGPMGKRRSI